MQYKKSGDRGNAPIDWQLPKQRSLPEIVAERIVEAIRTGALKAGERIVEFQLAKKMGVSRGPLREALKSLEAIHLVERRPGHGTYVSHVSTDDVVQMVMMRAWLEGLAARLVVARRTPDLIAQLESCHTRMIAAARTGNAQAWRDLDWRFHELVCTLSGNEFLLNAWLSISYLVRLFLHEHPGYERNAQEILAHHEAFMAALKDGDPDHAEKAFRSIILNSAFKRLGRPIPSALALVANPAENVPEIARDTARKRCLRGTKMTRPRV